MSDADDEQPPEGNKCCIDEKALTDSFSKALAQSQKPLVYQEVWNRAVERSADLVERHLATAMLFETSAQIQRYAVLNLPAEGLLLEFGVFQGKSIQHLRQLLNRQGDERPVYGFDAFKGLQEDWTGQHVPKHVGFNLGGTPPKMGEGIELVIGWLEDTLPPFLEKTDQPITFLHIDTDTYSPARLALQLCKSRFQVGSLILFDELHGYPNWENHEYRALTEMFSEDEYEYVGFGPEQALIRIKSMI